MSKGFRMANLLIALLLVGALLAPLGGMSPRAVSAAGPVDQGRTSRFETDAMSADYLDDGPGGPILVVATAGNPFGRYYAEILRAEGLNAFTVTDISAVTAGVLSGYDVVILGEMALTPAQVTLFETWVNGGGNLIAMRPDQQLASLLGLVAAGGSLAEGYLRIDTSGGAGVGLVNQTMQYHGSADRYTLNGATAVATLYADASTATSNPAVTLRSVGTQGGQAAAFSYDLARSVVYMRQGNPAWAGQDRDGVAPARTNDLFYGAMAGDVQPDWIDLNKVAIPQADEQQRLLANLIGQMNLDRKPLPRFWYFPSGERAVVIMTSDNHASAGVAPRFDEYLAASPAGCSVADWECVRSSAYYYPVAGLTDGQAAAYHAQGFELGIHIDTACQDWTPSAFAATYSSQLGAWSAMYPSLPAPASMRTHCIAWSDWATTPQVELANGARLDVNYYYYPASWVQDRPGFFTGSGMPMRFADVDGTLIDVYQAATQMTDETYQTWPYTIDTLLDRALGPEGYYGAFTANMHSDDHSYYSDQIVASAQARGVPVVSARQMLEWLDGRNGSAFSGLAWSGNTLSFGISVGAGAHNLQAMAPTVSAVGALTGLQRNGAPIAYTTQTIKGVEYAVFAAVAGAYEAVYASSATPTPTNTPAPPTATPTNTPVPPTATPTNTPVPPTATPTNTPVPPTATPTNTPVPPTATPANTPTATPTALPSPIFSDGFESGNLAAWTSSVTNGGALSASTAAALVGSYGMRAAINNNTAMYVTDDTPSAESHYRMGFNFDPNSIGMASGNAHYIFYGYSGTSTVVLRIEFRYLSPNRQIRAALVNNGTTWRTSSWFTISDAPHLIEVDWKAATSTFATNGYLTLWIDGTQRASLTGVANGARRIDRVRLGPVSGIDSGTRGVYYFDQFTSER